MKLNLRRLIFFFIFLSLVSLSLYELDAPIRFYDASKFFELSTAGIYAFLLLILIDLQRTQKVITILGKALCFAGACFSTDYILTVISIGAALSFRESNIKDKGIISSWTLYSTAFLLAMTSRVEPILLNTPFSANNILFFSIFCFYFLVVLKLLLPEKVNSSESELKVPLLMLLIPHAYSEIADIKLIQFFITYATLPVLVGILLQILNSRTRFDLNKSVFLVGLMVGLTTNWEDQSAIVGYMCVSIFLIETFNIIGQKFVDFKNEIRVIAYLLLTITPLSPMYLWLVGNVEDQSVVLINYVACWVFLNAIAVIITLNSNKLDEIKKTIQKFKNNDGAKIALSLCMVMISHWILLKRVLSPNVESFKIASLSLLVYPVLFYIFIKLKEISHNYLVETMRVNQLVRAGARSGLTLAERSTHLLDLAHLTVSDTIIKTLKSSIADLVSLVMQPMESGQKRGLALMLFLILILVLYAREIS